MQCLAADCCQSFAQLHPREEKVCLKILRFCFDLKTNLFGDVIICHIIIST